MPNYCVTAVNPITKEREVVTPPCSCRDICESIVRREQRKPRRNRAWLTPRVESYPPQQLVFEFQNDMTL